MNDLTRLARTHRDHQVSELLYSDNTEWMWDAACRERTEEMFPKRHKDITYIPHARAICNGRQATKDREEIEPCPVKEECKWYALGFPPTDMHGVWAGMTNRQLAAMQKSYGIRPWRPTIAQAHASG